MISYDRHNVGIRPSVSDDVSWLKRTLRPEDVAEVWASDHDKPGKALNDSFNSSTEAYTLTRFGYPIAMFGIVPVRGREDLAIIWLLGTPDIAKVKKSFVALTREVLKHFLTLYPCLFNFVDARYVKAVRWLSVCGATFGAPQPFGAEGLPFIPFVVRRS